MDITYLYTVTELVKAPVQGYLTDVVTKVNVSITATAGEETINWDLFQISLLAPDAEKFKPFAELTEEDVIAWVEESYPLGPIRESLAKQLDDIINPKEVITELPWATPAAE